MFFLYQTKRIDEKNDFILNLHLNRYLLLFMKFEKDILGPYQKNALAHWKKYLEANTEKLKASFQEIISKLQKKEVHPLKGIFSKSFSKKKNEIQKIEFWQNAWEYDMRIQFLDKNEEIVENELSEKFIFDKYDDFAPYLNHNFIYPKDCDVYLEEERESRFDEAKYHAFFFWLSKTWIECNGHRLNILTTTEENSVRRIFNLNYINWIDDMRDFDPYNSPIVKHPIKRDLTDFEIMSRIRLDSIRPFKVHWRYLENDDSFIEYAIYQYECYMRTGTKDKFNQIHFFKEEYKRVKISQEIDQYLNSGYFEKPRPESGPKIHKDLVEWKIGGYKKELVITKAEFNTIEQNIGFTLPGTYKWFIARMNGETQIHQMAQFRIMFENWGTMSKLVDVKNLTDEIIDLHKTHDIKRSLFPIAHCSNNSILLMDHENENIFLLNEKGNLDKLYENFQAFLGNCISISGYFCPRRVHLEHHNLATIKDWFNNGWDMKDLRILGNRSIFHEHYSDKMNMLLLKNVPDPNSIYIHGNTIKREYLDVLIDRGLDLKKKLEEQDGRLKNELNKRGMFDDLLEKYS